MAVIPIAMPAMAPAKSGKVLDEVMSEGLPVPFVGLGG
jgi:hypothetical protein